MRRPPLSRRFVWLLAVLLGALPETAVAHKGPPFPIVLDEPVAEGMKVSVWADPDIGQAQFFVVVEAPQGGMPETVPEVEMWTEPESGRLPRATWPAERMDLRDQLQFDLRPTFDRGDFWNVGFRIRPPGADAGEVTARVESTPPGFGAWDLAIYLFPFVFLGGFWVAALSRRTRIRKLLAEQARAAAAAQNSDAPRSTHQ